MSIAIKRASLTLLLDRPIAFHRPFVKITGSINSALMLSQALYWSNRTSNDDGWFYKTRDEWMQETSMTRTEQETARRLLRETGFWKEELRGLPARVYYQIDLDKLIAVLDGNPPQGRPEKQPQSRPRNPPQGRQETSQPITETTTETTTKITHDSPELALQSQDARAKPSVNEFCRIPLTGNKEHVVTKEDIAEYKADFPGLDVEQVLRVIKRWNQDNPSRRKTVKGIRNHISMWLGREQNRGPRGPGPSGPNGTRNGYHYGNGVEPPDLPDLRDVKR